MQFYRSARSAAPLLLLHSLFFTACGGRTMNKNMAQDLLTGLPQSVLSNEDVEIESVSQMGQKSAIIETRLHAAFRFEKIGGKWEPREFRIGHGQWENMNDLINTLQKIKSDETQRILERIADAIDKFRQANGRLPSFSDYISLSNALNPEFLSPLARMDAWDRPLHAIRVNDNLVKLASAGADGQLGTEDDIELTRAFPP